jgi:ArsR family transcriptional regulator
MNNPDPVLFAKALADKTRQSIMQLCCCREITVGQIVAQIDLSQPTVSHHLAILREAGLVAAREDGKQTFYSLNQDRVARCCGQLMLDLAPGSETTGSLRKILET